MLPLGILIVILNALGPHGTIGFTKLWFTSTDGYDHSSSKAERDGKFIGLMCDEDNQYDVSEARAKDWVVQLQGEGFF